MSLLYIVMMFAAPAINPTAEYVHANLSFSSLIPNFNVTYFHVSVHSGVRCGRLREDLSLRQ